MDETYIKVHGKWCSLYRAIDADGNLVDWPLSEKRDMDAAQPFFKQAVAVYNTVHDAAHGTFMTLDAHTSSRENEV